MDGAPPHTMTPKVVQELKLRYEGLKSGVERANAQEHWEQIAEVIDPNHRGFVGKRTPGDRRMQKVYDATGIHAADLLTAGLHGTATNPATKWHRLSTQFPDANKDPGVRGYLDKRVEILFSRRYSPGTRFTSAINEVFDSASRYGTGIMYITQRRDGRNLYECRSLSECVIAENDEGDIDTVMRCFTWTVRQCVLEWGVDGVSDKVREMYNARKFDEIIEVIHSVTPRKGRDPGNKGSKNMPFASIYFELNTAHVLEESGYPKFPFAIFRWMKRPGETYGTGPASVALPDVKMLQAMSLVMIKAAQKVADPPLFLPDDGFASAIRTLPGALNFYRGQREVYQMPVSGGLPITLEIMEELRNRIRQTFFTDILQFVSDKDMTATEVQQRTAERMRLLGPVLGRLEEFLGHVVDIEDDIAARAGVLPPVPESLGEGGGLIPDGLDVELVVEYVGPIFQAQRAADASGFAQMMQYAMPMIEADGGASFNATYSAPRIMSWLGRTFMVPAELELTDEEKAQAQKQTMAAQGAMAAKPAAEAANAGAGAVKQLAEAQQSGGVDLAGLMEQMAADGTLPTGAMQ
jgi:hypothetical protein